MNVKLICSLGSAYSRYSKAGYGIAVVHRIADTYTYNIEKLVQFGLKKRFATFEWVVQNEI